LELGGKETQQGNSARKLGQPAAIPKVGAANSPLPRCPILVDVKQRKGQSA
jgi:hypothetical protein